MKQTEKGGELKLAVDGLTHRFLLHMVKIAKGENALGRDFRQPEAHCKSRIGGMIHRGRNKERQGLTGLLIIRVQGANHKEEWDRQRKATGYAAKVRTRQLQSHVQDARDSKAKIEKEQKA